MIFLFYSVGLISSTLQPYPEEKLIQDNNRLGHSGELTICINNVPSNITLHYFIFKKMLILSRFITNQNWMWRLFLLLLFFEAMCLCIIWRLSWNSVRPGRLALNSERSACLCFLIAGLKAWATTSSTLKAFLTFFDYSIVKDVSQTNHYGHQLMSHRNNNLIIFWLVT